MSGTITPMDYRTQLDEVTDYMYGNLDGKLDLDELASVANMSKFHWHRIYRAMRGETAAMTVKRLRLHRAAGFLANTDMPIDEVADRTGYSNLQSFTRAFGDSYGLPPAQYRKRGNHMKFKPGSTASDGIERSVEIKERDAVEVIGVDHEGSFMNIGNAYTKLHGWLGAMGLHGSTGEMIAIYFDDPNSVPEPDLRSFAGVAISPMPELESPVRALTVVGGRYAVLRHIGPYATMQAAYDWLLGEWLPSSGEAVRDEPLFELYVNTPMDTAPADLITEIHLPLAG
ncbi:MAG TPA: AraC family transcriptional regulator [Solirubrobacterales bacterium]|nr:AraC family transcriptional regulator [Solirubrobacterales bacterium]